MFSRSDLSNFFGSENIYRYMGGVLFTDGVKFIMENGAHWLCSDAMLACKLVPKLAKEDFVCIKAKVNDGKAIVTYDDGNGKVLHKQEYGVSDLPCEINFYYENNTFMLTSER